MTLASHRHGAAPDSAAGLHPEGGILEIGLMGELTLALGGTPLVLTGRKARCVLAYLAMEAPAPASRERLAGLFWSDASERQARSSLRQVLFELREALEPRGCRALLIDRDRIALAPGQARLDLEQALAAIAAGEVPEVLVSRAVRAEQILASYEDISPLFGEWLATARRTTHERLLRALARAYADPAVPRRNRRLLAEAALRLDPLHEDACRTVMRIAAEDGEIGAALRCYAALYEVMGAELDMEPSAATQQLVAAIKKGEIGPLPGAAAAPPPPAASPPAPAIARPQALAGIRRGRIGRLAPDDTPVIAVLPLRSIGPEPPPAWLAEGIVEDIVYVLAGLREPAVISTNSTRRFTGADTLDLAQVGETLGADYVVTGTLRVIGQRLRIAIELAEATQGALLWGKTVEVAQDALFEAQADIAAGIANALIPRLTEAELRASRRQEPEDLGAYHLLLQARDRMFQLTAEAFEEAGTLLVRARALDPDYAPIHATLIDWYSLRIFQGWSPDRAADTEALEAAARTALRLDPGHARALALYGHNLTITALRYEEALTLLDRAVASAPNDAETLSWTSPTLAYVGRAADAIGRAQRALALSPQDPFLFRYEHFLSIGHYAAGDLEATAHWGLRSASRNPNYTSNLRFTVAALAGLGRRAEYEPLVARLMTLQPDLRINMSFKPGRNFRDEAIRARHAEYLRLAGIPA